MAGNRKLPFGYRMELGKVVLHPQESVVVREIFEKYILGASYKALVDSLREQDVVYDQGKVWNKNMVARILENKKYAGESGWPAIITEEQYDRADEKRSHKVSFPNKTEAQKALRKLSGCSVSEFMEQQVRNMLNALIADPQQIHAPHMIPQDMRRDTALEQAWESQLEQQPLDECAVKQLAMKIAAAEYIAIGNQEYETERLQRLFRNQKPMTDLDENLLRYAVSAIQPRCHRLIIHLKNGQMIGGNAP